MPISLEQWRAAVGRWVARIQRTLIIRRGVKRSPPCASNQEWESSLGQSHTGERMCMGKRKGRKKHEDDSFNDPAIASDEFCDGVIVLAATSMCCGRTVFKDCSDGKPASSLKELFGWTALGAFLVIMLLLLTSGDVEPNPGPVDRGAHTLLSISSTLHQLGMLVVGHIASQWKQVATHFVVESCEVCKFGSGHPEETSQGALIRKGASDTNDVAKKTICSVLEAHDASGHSLLAEQLKLCYGGPVTALASPPDPISPSCHMSYNQLNELPHFGFDFHCLCCHFTEWMTAGPTRSDLGCPLSDGVSVSPLSTGRPAQLLLLGKSSIDFDALTRRMAALITFILRHVALVALAFLLLFLLEVTVATVDKAKAWWKGGSPSGNSDISYQYKKMRTFKSVCVQCPLNLQMAVTIKYKFRTASQQLCGLLAKPCVFVRELLLLAGDIEPNPGPLQVEEILSEFREQFISDVDVNMVVMELLDKYIISDGVRESIERADGPRHRSEILHDYLKRTCTEEAFRTVCGIIASVRGNPKMSALGKGMQRSLESGVSSRGRHEVMAPLTSAAAHGSGQSQQIMGHASGIPRHGVSGSATRQECLPPPTTAATHGQSLQAVGHHPGNTGNGVSGSATRQECLPPPTTAATHGQSLQAVGHPPGNTGYVPSLPGMVPPSPFQYVLPPHMLPGPSGVEYQPHFVEHHQGVSGSATRQECLPPPTTAATHGQSLQAVGHPPGNTGNVPNRPGRGPPSSFQYVLPSHMLPGPSGGIEYQPHFVEQHQVEREGGGPDVGLTLTRRKNSEEFQKFSSKMRTHYAMMKVVDDRWRKSQSMEYVKLALSRFKLDFEDEQKKFVEAISDPEGVDKVYTVVKNAKIDYKEIPTMVKEKKLVIISGAPGVGKSTLAKKLCQDISNKISVHKYDLVLMVELRDLIVFKGIGEPFKLHHLLQLFTESTQVAAQLATELQAHDGKGVLLILDGYDELLQELREAPFFTDLLAHSPKSPLHECDIVLTSRSILTSQIYHHLTKASTAGDVTNIEVLGFTKAQVKRYAQLYFEAEGMKPLCPQFLTKLESVPQIYSLCSIPVVLSIICRVYLAKKDLPPTLTEAYSDFVFEKVLLNSPDIDVDSLLHLPPTHDFYQLCELAFSCVVEQKVIFTSAELKDLSARYSNRESGCGLLTARPVDKLRCVLAVDSFFFIHLTVQEFLSALHICRQEVEVQKKIWAKYLGQPHLAQVWKFFCGLSHLDNFDALEVAPKLKDEEVLVQSLYESQNEAVVAQVIPAHFGPDPKVKLASVHSSIAHGYCFQQFRSMRSLEVVGRLNTNLQISSFLEPVLSALSGAVLQHLAIRNFRPKDWIEVAEVLKKLWHRCPQVDVDHSADEGCSLHGMPSQITLEAIPVDVLCEIWEVLDDVEHLTCERVSDPHKTLSSDLLSKMTLAQNKTIRVLKLTGADVRDHRLESKILEGKAKGDLTQYPVMKQLMNHIQLGVLKNTTLERVKLDFPPWLSGCIKRDDTQQHLKNITLEYVALDVLCDVVVNFEHMKELLCMSISDPQESLSRNLLSKMTSLLALNNTTVRLVLHCQDLTQKEDVKVFTHHLLLGLSDNTTLTDLSLSLPKQCWDWLQEGSLVPRHVKRVTLGFVPLDLVCDVVKRFEHVEDLHCVNIQGPQQSGVAENGLKLEELEGKLAGHESLKKLRFDFWYDIVPQTLVQKFGVAAVRGVARNKGIAEFKLEPRIHDHKVVDDILAQLTPDERRKFRVGKDGNGRPSIELCPVGDPSSGGAPPSTDLQSISEDAVMDLDRPEGGPSGSVPLAHPRLFQPLLPQMLPHPTQRLLLPSLQHSQQQPPAPHPLAQSTHPPSRWSGWTTPPSPQPCAPRHMSPNPWRPVGYPPQSVGQYQAPHPLVRPPRPLPTFSAPRQMFPGPPGQGLSPFPSEQSFAPRRLSTCPWPSTVGYHPPNMGQYQAPHPPVWPSPPTNQSLIQRAMIPGQFPMGYDSYSVEQQQVVLRSRWAPPPSSQPCAPRHMPPHQWQPPQSVGQYQDVPGPSRWTPPMFAGRKHERQWREEGTSCPPQQHRVQREGGGRLDGGLTTRRAEEAVGHMTAPSLPSTEPEPTPRPTGGIPGQQPHQVVWEGHINVTEPDGSVKQVSCQVSAKPAIANFIQPESWPLSLDFAHYPKPMLQQLKDQLDLNSHTACTVTFQFTEPVHYIASLNAITTMDPRDFGILNFTHQQNEHCSIKAMIIVWTDRQFCGIVPNDQETFLAELELIKREYMEHLQSYSAVQARQTMAVEAESGPSTPLSDLGPTPGPRGGTLGQ